MTSAEMVGKLGMRLNREAPESDFSVTERYSYLNDGQLYAAQVLPIHLVRAIETVSPALAVDSAGAIGLETLTRLTVVQEASPSTTVFKGTAGQGLSAVNDAYNGATIQNITNGTNHIVTDYVGATLQFTVTAEVATSPRTWDSGDEFYFPNRDLALPVLLNGDRGILDVKHSSGYYCRQIFEEEWQRAVEHSLVYPSSSPVYYLQGTKIYLNPYTYGTTTGIIRYRSEPDAITSSAPCVFGSDVQDMIIDYGVYLGLKATPSRFDLAMANFRILEKQVNQAVNRYAPKGRVVFEVGQVLGRGCGGSDGRTLS